MNKQQVREWLAKALRREEVPEPLWRYLDDVEGLVDDVIRRDDEDENLAALLRVARRLLAFVNEMGAFRPQGQRAGQAVSQSPQVVPPRGPRQVGELKRAEAVSILLAAQAAERGLVQWVQRDLLGNQLVPADRFESFCLSPAMRFLSLEVARRLASPLAEHVSTLLSYERIGEQGADIPELRRIMDLRIRLSREWWTDPSFPQHRATIRLDNTGQTLTAERKASSPVREMEVLYSWTLDDLVDGDLRSVMAPGFVTIWENSLLDHVLLVADWLTQEYPWTEGQALRFLLTGEVPVIDHLVAYLRVSTEESPGAATITVTAAPWVSPESVADLFRRVQRTYSTTRPRQVSSRNLTLVRFVAARRLRAESRGLPQPTWAALMKELNSLWPKWAHHDYHNFARDYHRAAGILLLDYSTAGNPANFWSQREVRFGMGLDRMGVPDPDPVADDGGGVALVAPHWIQATRE